MPPPKVAEPAEPAPQTLNNNWVIKTDFKNIKNIKALEEDIKGKDSKPIIIVKPNLNMTIVQNPPEPPRRPASEKKKDTGKEQTAMPREILKEQLRDAFKENQREAKPLYRETREVRESSKDK